MNCTTIENCGSLEFYDRDLAEFGMPPFAPLATVRLAPASCGRCTGIAASGAGSGPRSHPQNDVSPTPFRGSGTFPSSSSFAPGGALPGRLLNRILESFQGRCADLLARRLRRLCCPQLKCGLRGSPCSLRCARLGPPSVVLSRRPCARITACGLRAPRGTRRLLRWRGSGRCRNGWRIVAGDQHLGNRLRASLCANAGAGGCDARVLRTCFSSVVASWDGGTGRLFRRCQELGRRAGSVARTMTRTRGFSARTATSAVSTTHGTEGRSPMRVARGRLSMCRPTP